MNRKLILNEYKFFTHMIDKLHDDKTEQFTSKNKS